MTGAAKPRTRIGKRIKDIKNKESQLHSLYRRLDSPNGISVPSFAGVSGGENSGSESTNFLPTAGGVMMGAIAFFSKLIQISTGEIDISKSSGDYTSRVIISPQTGSTDDLVTITGAENAGQLLLLQGIQTNTITLQDSLSSGTAWVISTSYTAGDIVTHGGNKYSCKLTHTSSSSDEPDVGASWEDKWFKGNIETIDGNDFSLADDDVIILMFDGTDNNWQQVTTGKQFLTGGGSGATTELDNLGTTAVNANIIPDTDVTYNLGSSTLRWGTLYNSSIDASGVLTVAGNTNLNGDVNIGNNGSVDTVSFYSKLDTDFDMNSYDINNLDRLVFDKSVGNTLGTTDTGITSNALGDMVFNLNGTSASYDFIMNNDSVIRLQINNNTVVSQSLFPVDSATDTLGGGGGEWNTGHIKQITVGGAQKGIDNIGELKFVNNTSTPSGNGIFYFDGTDVKVKTGSLTKNLSDIDSGGGVSLSDNNVWTGTNTFQDVVSMTGSTVNIGDAVTDRVNFISKLGTNLDMNSYDIDDLDRLLFSTTGTDNLSSTDYGIGTDSTDSDNLYYNTPSTKSHIFTTGGTERVEIKSTGLTVQNSLLTNLFTASGESNLNGDVNIGDATTDSLTVTSKIDSDLIPSGTRNLGSSSNKWENLYIDGTANIDKLSTSERMKLPVGTNLFD